MSFADHLARTDRAVRGQLGGEVVYTPGVGAPVTVDGVFDAAYVRASLEPAGIASSGPAVFLTLADLPSDPGADTTATVTVGGVVYQPYEVKPDGLGGVLLMLHKVT